MSKALVKWRPAELLPGSKMDAALAQLRHGTELEQPRGRVQAPPALAPKGGDIVDLPRVCAVHDKPYAARYIAGADGRFHYSQTIRITESLYLEQYVDCSCQQHVQGNELAEEFCPWCGGHGYVAVLCSRCRAEICYGKTVGRYFRCRESCGNEGTMRSEPRMHTGVTPGLPSRGGYTAR
jgi:hypothetical protein